MVALAPADDEVREALSRSVARQAPNAGTLPDVSLRARIFLANAAVTAIAAIVLLLTPVTVSSPAHLREIAIVVGGLSAILVINLVLLRRAFGPLERMTAVMRSVELLQPGRRVPVYGQEAEIVDLTRAFNEMLERLEGEQQDSERRSLEAQESERQRVARELHDEVGQSLTAVMLQLDRVARFAPDGLREEMGEAREVARSSLEDVRAIAQRLRPEALDDLGLPSALTALTDRVSERTGIRIEKRFASPCPEMTRGGARLLPDSPGGRDQCASPCRGLGGLHRVEGRRRGRDADGGRRRDRPGWCRARLGHPRDARTRIDDRRRPRDREQRRCRDEGDPAVARGIERDMTVPLKTRILLADDHAVVRRGLRMVLDAEPDLEVVIEAADGAEAVEHGLREDIPLAVLDVTMPRLTGIQAARSSPSETPACAC